MRVWKEDKRPSMHMVDNVGKSFLKMIPDHFSLLVGEILNFLHYPLPQTAANKQHR